MPYAAAVQLHRAGQLGLCGSCVSTFAIRCAKTHSCPPEFGPTSRSRRKVARGRSVLRQGSQSGPSQRKCVGDLGNALIRLEQWDEAEKALRKAVVLVPASSRTWLNLGCVLLQSNCWSESEAALREALRFRLPRPCGSLEQSRICANRSEKVARRRRGPSACNSHSPDAPTTLA